MLYITSRRDIVRSSPDVAVKVYGNVAQARLRVNGAEFDTRLLQNHIAIWNIRLKPGKNIISVSSGTVTDEVSWVLQAQ